MLADNRGDEMFERSSSAITLGDASSDAESRRTTDLGECSSRPPATSTFVMSRGASHSPLLSVGELESVEAGEPKKEDRREDDPLRTGRLSISGVSSDPAPLNEVSSATGPMSIGSDVARSGPIVLARLRSVLFMIEEALPPCDAPADARGDEDNKELAFEKLLRALVCESAELRMSRAPEGVRTKSVIASARLASVRAESCDVLVKGS